MILMISTTTTLKYETLRSAVASTVFSLGRTIQQIHFHRSWSIPPIYVHRIEIQIPFPHLCIYVIPINLVEKKKKKNQVQRKTQKSNKQKPSQSHNSGCTIITQKQWK